MGKKFICALILIGAVFLFQACVKTPEEKLMQTIEAAEKGKSGAAERLGDLMLKAAAINVFSDRGIFCDGNMLWTAEDGAINVLYPKKSSFKLFGEDMNLMRAADETSVVFSSGKELFVFDWGGTLAKRLPAGTEKAPVLAVAAAGGKIYYFAGSSIYWLDSFGAEDAPKRFVKESFFPPYAKLFKAYMYARGNRLGLLLGVAGSYYFNVIDLPSAKTLNTKIRMSSPKLYLDEESVLHIFGNTGKWSLSRFWFESGRRSNYQQYKEIIDVEVFPDGLMVEAGDFRLSRPGERDIVLPDIYRFLGACNGMPLIEYEGSMYALNADKLYSFLTLTEGLLPSKENKLSLQK